MVNYILESTKEVKHLDDFFDSLDIPSVNEGDKNY